MAEPQEPQIPPIPLNASPPDLTNDTLFATNIEGGEDGTGDVDTCRICRGEGSDTEPLFHPCKCSGSIRYVHQDCLMEWLSHSQKKHCELCKTPFRFTKLYFPNMPPSLPLSVLLWHVLTHIVKNLATWLRFCLVVLVWLLMLPYGLRQVWRVLFWFSDGGWPKGSSAADQVRNSTTALLLEWAHAMQLAGLDNGTSPVTPLQAVHMTPASVNSLMSKLLSQTLGKNATDRPDAGLFKSMAQRLNTTLSAVTTENSANSTHLLTYPINLPYSSPSPSILSDVSFLQNLTRSAYVNHAIIAVTEGYIITVLVVICFILVFLIREWVVQQQPGINMGAGFNAEVADIAGMERAQAQQDFLEARPDAHRNEEETQAENGVPARDENADLNFQVQNRLIARPRRRNVHFGDVDEMIPRETPAASNEGRAGPFQTEDAGSSSSTARPSPPRDAFSPAVEIQRQLTEEPRMTEEFLAILRRANNDPVEVLRIIEQENKTDEMSHWVNAMVVLQNCDAPEDDPDTEMTLDISTQGAMVTEGGPEFAFPGPRRYSWLEPPPAESEGSSASSESWVDVPKSAETQHEDSLKNCSGPPNDQHGQDEANTRIDKGKARVEEFPEIQSSQTVFDRANRNLPPPISFSGNSRDHAHPDLGLDTFTHNGLRPRSVSDGPQRKDKISLLANNNWSFSNLSEDDDKASGSTTWYEDTITNAVRESLERDPDAMDYMPSPLVSVSDEARLMNVAAPPPLMTDAEITQMEQNPIEVIGEDGNIRTYRNIEETFAAHPGSDNEADDEVEPNPAEPNNPIPQPQEPAVPRPAEARGILGGVADFLWGGVDDDRRDDNDERAVQDLAAEAPFIPVINARQDLLEQGGVEQNREVVEAAFAAGIDLNDQDAIDDAEDFEGIMELVGMRGPLFSLVQNALFSAVLLALAVAIGVWIPYNIGRVSVLLLANPGPAFKLPLKIVFGMVAFAQDLAVAVVGLVSYFLIRIISLPVQMWTYFAGSSNIGTALQESQLGPSAIKLSSHAFGRIMDGTINSLTHITDSEMFAFSAASHEALNTLHSLIINTVGGIGGIFIYLFTGDWHLSVGGINALFLHWMKYGWYILTSLLPTLLAKPDNWVISIDVAERVSPLDMGLSVWDGWSRFWVTVTGYTVLCILGAMYVRRSSPFSSAQQGREMEASILDMLNQAGGVMKVILIISIEMLVFPLYCGLLLDGALLPLFEKATIMSRINFTVDSPFTSMFVHWFVGTCYMFHFALFVSMCRKIMRKGVLYFIRDPDDPTFHPVRDVLERNVATQLRKILFSAFVYGALVVVCLGGVVWGLAFTFKSVLPIHWSSNEPVLEFPIDLLFYNFLMPLAVRFFKPSDGLHAIYAWWFRQCARFLRLTWFMFDERKLDEEGVHVRKTWGDVFKGSKGDPTNAMKTEDGQTPFNEDPELRAYFCRDGKYVRAPASDQVRIPKGSKIFLQVDELNNRVDGKWDRPDGTHGRSSELYKQVYIPPYFSLRICLFIVFIWLFAAFTGVSVTIVPLVVGRQVFAKIIPPHVRKNDVYAFSIGIYILGSTLYAILHFRQFLTYARNSLAIDAETPHNILRRVTGMSLRLARIVWTYSAFLFLLPTLFAFLVEFYLIVPLHTYFSVEERHVVHFVQSWTLGLLYVKLTTRIILWYEDSRPAQSLRAVTRNGYLDPDAKLATRSFILPATLILSTALFFPWVMARFAASTVLKNYPEIHFLTYRYAYPFFLALICMGVGLYRIFGMLKEWRMMIKDEVYLIGERLHNFGDRRVVSPTVAASSGMAGVRRLEA